MGKMCQKQTWPLPIQKYAAYRTQNTRKVKKNIVVPKQEGTNVVIDPGVCCCSLTVTPIFLFFSRFV